MSSPTGVEDHGIVWPAEDAKPVRDAIRTWAAGVKTSLHHVRATYTPFDYAATVLPCLRWLRGYNVRRSLVWDLAAGASVAALVVPQGMAYVRLAGLPQQFGLYGAFAPVIVYAFLGSSRHLSVGPVVVTALLLGSGLPPIVARDHPGFKQEANANRPNDPAGQDAYNRAAVQVGLLAGALYTAAGVFRLSFLINFLSHSVIAGFMSGAALTIAFQQLRNGFGYDVIVNKAWTAASPKSVQRYIPYPRFKGDDKLFVQAKLLFSPDWVATFKWRDAVIFFTSIAILVLMKELGSRSRKLLALKALGPLTVCMLSISVVAGLKLGCDPADKAHNPACVKTVGVVPRGLPRETVSWWGPMTNFPSKMALAILICAIDLLESVSIAKAVALKNNYTLNNTQEVIGLGAANLAGAMFSCMTTTGSFGRSGMLDAIGAHSQLAGFISALFVGAVLLFLTPLFYNMPLSAPAAIVTAVMLGLIQFKEWWFLWRINKLDWLVFTAAAVGTVFAGVELGLAISIGLSIVLALAKAAFPHTAVVGRLPGTQVYRNVAQYASAETQPGILIVRVDAPLFFANVAPVADALRRYEREAATAAAKVGAPAPRAVVIDLSPVTDFDATAVHWFTAYVRDARKRGLIVALANPARRVTALLAAAGVDAVVGRDRVYACVGEAVAALRKEDGV